MTVPIPSRPPGAVVVPPAALAPAEDVGGGGPVASLSEPSEGYGLVRSAIAISAWNAVFRATGFVRVLAVGAAAGAVVLFALLRRRLGPAPRVAPSTARAASAAIAAGAVAVVCASVVDGGGRVAAFLDLANAGPPAAVAGAAVLCLLEAPELDRLTRRMATRGAW